MGATNACCYKRDKKEYENEIVFKPGKTVNQMCLVGYSWKSQCVKEKMMPKVCLTPSTNLSILSQNNHQYSASGQIFSHSQQIDMESLLNEFRQKKEFNFASAESLNEKSPLFGSGGDKYQLSNPESGIKLKAYKSDNYWIEAEDIEKESKHYKYLLQMSPDQMLRRSIQNEQMNCIWEVDSESHRSSVRQVVPPFQAEEEIEEKLRDAAKQIWQQKDEQNQEDFKSEEDEGIQFDQESRISCGTQVRRVPSVQVFDMSYQDEQSDRPYKDNNQDKMSNYTNTSIKRCGAAQSERNGSGSNSCSNNYAKQRKISGFSANSYDLNPYMGNTQQMRKQLKLNTNSSQSQYSSTSIKRISDRQSNTNSDEIIIVKNDSNSMSGRLSQSSYLSVKRLSSNDADHENRSEEGYSESDEIQQVVNQMNKGIMEQAETDQMVRIHSISEEEDNNEVLSGDEENAFQYQKSNLSRNLQVSEALSNRSKHALRMDLDQSNIHGQSDNNIISNQSDIISEQEKQENGVLQQYMVEYSAFSGKKEKSSYASFKQKN